MFKGKAPDHIVEELIKIFGDIAPDVKSGKTYRIFDNAHLDLPIGFGRTLSSRWGLSQDKIKHVNIDQGWQDIA
jgi:hypothetical protein